MRGRAPQGEEKSVLGAVGEVSRGAPKAGCNSERVTGTALMASGAAALGGQDRSGTGLRPRNGAMCERFWGVPRGAAKRSWEGCRRSSTGRGRTPLPGFPAGVSSGRLSRSVVNQGAKVPSASAHDPP